MTLVEPVQHQHVFQTGLTFGPRAERQDQCRPGRPCVFDKSSYHSYIVSFTPNCTCRDDPDSPVANRVLVMRPKAGLPTTFPGCPKLAWLKRSKISARNWIRILSPICVFFTSEKSVLRKPGPITTFRPKLPKRSTAVNTEVSNQRSTLPMVRTGPLTSGRSVPATPFTVLLLVTMFTGFPDWAWTMIAACQFSAQRLPWKGRS